MSLQFVIADDHNIVREGVRKILLEAFPGADIHDAQNGIELVSQVKRIQPALVIADIAMPYASGLDVINEIRRWKPDVKIVILTGLTSRQLIARAQSLGVDGVFLKSGPPAELRDGLISILSGKQFYSQSTDRMLHEGAPLDALSDRETEILRHIAQGAANGRIADALNISESTVDKHKTSMMRKLQVRSTAKLIAVALREGLIDGQSGQ